METHLGDHFSYRKLLKAVFPTIMMMIWVSIYSVIDGVFVSNFVGTDAFAGLNLIMPVTCMVGALGFMLGTGGSALVAKTLGEGKEERANQIFSMIVYFTAALSIVVSVVIFAFMEQISIALGSISGEAPSEAMIQNAVLYGRITVLFQVMFMLENVFQSFFVVAERANIGFIVILIAGLTNIALDALFVGTLGWGLAGAAAATGIAQAVGTFISLIYFSKKGRCLLYLTKARLQFRPLFKSCTNGSSEFLSNICMSVVSILFNFQLLKYAGVNGVAAYGVIMYAGFIFAAVFIGFSIGVAPLVGFNYGAQNTEELKNIRKKCLTIVFVFSVIIVTFTELLAQPLCSIFSHGDNELLTLSANGFRIYGISFAIFGFSIFMSSFFTALNNGLVSATISFSRTAVFQVVCIIFMPMLFGLNGIWYSVVVAEVLSICVSFLFLFANKKKYNY